ncbi:MAG: glycine cleavage system aminomethyltransferase GcvT [Candidatus Neomarinimicrobiota bacterium]
MAHKPKKTALYDFHIANSNNVVNFSGFYLPVFYSSILDEHRAVRNKAALFDVCHMGQLIISGKESEKFVQTVTTNDVRKLSSGQAQYSAICNESGGLIDDVIVYKRKSGYMIVVNASGIEKKYNWLKSVSTKSVQIENVSNEISMIAIQGPLSRKIIQASSEFNISKLKFYNFIENIDFLGFNIMLSRTGYTGELGFEIYCSNEAVSHIWNSILEDFKSAGVKPAGLGSRDTLRLEMGYLLYGSDMNIKTNPFKAGLGWITNLNKGDFIGRGAMILNKKSLDIVLIYFVMIEKGIPRPGCDIIMRDEVVGYVTSGTISPSLNKGIGIGYIKADCIGKDKLISIGIRGRNKKGELVKAPFYKRGSLNS